MSDLERMELATDWLQRLQESPHDEAVLHDWLRWYRSDPQNAAAFDQMHSVWGLFDDAALRATVGRPAADGGLIPATRRRKFAKRLALAAGALLVVGLGAGWLAWLGQYQTRTLTTNVAEESKRVLADGSRVNVGASSRVTARYSQSERTILVENGEAYFDVKKDSQRPFVVRAGALRVTAIGTAFTVKRVLDHTSVTVSEGVVRVSPGGAQARSGERVIFFESSGRLSVSKVDPQDGWPFRQGVLHFVDEPLKDVLAEVNRFSARPISLRSQKLLDEPYTGTVYEDRIDDWLQALTQVFPLQLTSDQGGNPALVEK